MRHLSQTAFQAVNWNKAEDPYSKLFWDQNVRQFWVDEEIPLADDKLVWMTLNREEQRTYEHVLGGLTLLDTEQGSHGMPLISQAVPNPQSKAVLGFMGAMEHMHAKSYSSIYSTLCTTERIDEIFRWVEKNRFLQSKIEFVHDRYSSIRDDRTLYLAMTTSVFLESFLFYSGFFYPLYLAGQGKLVNSGEIINLIVRDESVHGVYVGLLAQQVFERLPAQVQREVQQETLGILEALHTLETRYTSELYTGLGLTEQVLQFSRYNADKALMNLGQEVHFDVSEEDINPMVLTGLRTETRNHDFFSTKGNGYIKTTRVEALQNEDFIF
ncbi:class 1b ribonucleoside-diphosphate reductase subunit beta [Deinococcus cellulosilyticus]|uniref:Ribonucleoside-diphosphate reductase subunit beta n=1 Tax=Deinococcus cellulosilyticus (strain DSM 18568 / NBRC 106333 / KACC 11606 / 5516J-15) TaxID=1223518 RepID=A0A511N5Z6_DEIC1|nr:class 1b ribonucleoside-diphosphate reductase subunit beta [Deinococcus cellulosilyticus]GEM47856.1 ribonucleoside-diphosphate reductase subunit beta [Deinococcus cellulosilyticus NBRC 106333 = KACC 11606]